jgi:hypothetical protein
LLLDRNGPLLIDALFQAKDGVVEGQAGDTELRGWFQGLDNKFKGII